MRQQVTRRSFLRNIAWTGSGLVILLNSRSIYSTQANEKLNIAGIGIGGRGADDINGVASENIVALCDVDQKHAAQTFERYPQAKQYKDFRRMLDTRYLMRDVRCAMDERRGKMGEGRRTWLNPKH
jgi:hypothetical protein